VFVPGKVFQPSLMLLSKAGAYPSGTSFQVLSCNVGSCLTHKHWTRPEKRARDKSSSLFQTLVNYGLKKFYYWHLIIQHCSGTEVFPLGCSRHTSLDQAFAVLVVAADANGGVTVNVMSLVRHSQRCHCARPKKIFETESWARANPVKIFTAVDYKFL